MLTYHEKPAPASLSRHVECIWTIHTGDGVDAHPVPPDGCCDIVFDTQNGLRAVGAMTAQQSFQLSPQTSLSGVRFRPGMARSFLQVPASELTDKSVNFDGPSTSSMRNAASLMEAMSLLVGHLQPLARPLNAVQRAIEAMSAAHGTLDIDFCARHANLSPRQFRRRCEEESGLTPKLLARILRFRYASQLARSENQHRDWPAIAAEAAYFDQAHLIRDFRQFTRETPMAVFSNTKTLAPNILKV